MHVIIRSLDYDICINAQNRAHAENIGRRVMSRLSDVAFYPYLGGLYLFANSPYFQIIIVSEYLK